MYRCNEGCLTYGWTVIKLFNGIIGNSAKKANTMYTSITIISGQFNIYAFAISQNTFAKCLNILSWSFIKISLLVFYLLIWKMNKWKDGIDEKYVVQYKPYKKYERNEWRLWEKYNAIDWNIDIILHISKNYYALRTAWVN